MIKVKIEKKWSEKLTETNRNKLKNFRQTSQQIRFSNDESIKNLREIQAKKYEKDFTKLKNKTEEK